MNADRAIGVIFLLYPRKSVFIRGNPRSKIWRSTSACLTQPPGCLQCKIRQDRVRAGALDASQRLEHDRALVEPAIRERSLLHRIFAADLVDQRRRAETVLH